MKLLPVSIIVASALALFGCASTGTNSSGPTPTVSATTNPGNEWGYDGKTFTSATDLANAIGCVPTGDSVQFQSYVYSGVMCQVNRTLSGGGTQINSIILSLYRNHTDESQGRTDGEASPLFTEGTVCMVLGPGWIASTTEGGGTGVCDVIRGKVGGSVDYAGS